MVRILQIGAHLAPNLIGGAEVSAGEIGRQLTRAGLRVLGFSSSVNNERKSPRVLYTGSLHRVTAATRLRGLSKYAYYLLEQVNIWPAVKVYLLIRRAKIDIAIVHSWRGLGEWLPVAVMLSGKPAIFILHDFSFVCLNKGARRRGKNCEKQCVDCKLSSRFRIALAQSRQGICLVAPSEAHAESVRKLSGASLQTLVIHNPNVYLIKSRARVPAEQLKFGYVGRLEEDKGFGTFLSLARKFSGKADFVVAGEGAMTAEAVAAAAAGQIRYLGQVPQSEMSEVYDQLDVLVVPSKWRENFPGVCVQAAMSGLPIIGSVIGGIPEIVTDHKTGRLIAPNDTDGWESAVEEFVSNRELVATYSRNALLDGDRFDPVKNMSKYRDLVLQMAEAAR
ncbi:glycosyltransferase involved in cell wall biosynthesis [Bradyrhizobium ottawaense]|uniref:glycosyltransferase n=1 Tax=Bradyrhizobium ottawaense TaxID=931866 RepID=UPI003518494A